MSTTKSLSGALALVALGVSLAGCGGSSSSSSTTTTGGTTTQTTTVARITPIGLSLSGLKTLAKAVPTPIYWAGPKPKVQYELSRLPNGNVFVRYLPPGVKVGTTKASYLVVATYPYRNAFGALQQAAGSSAETIPHGGIAYPDKNKHSVHLAYPKSNYQVEVYSPTGAQSLRVARSGNVRPVA
jgi:hypothetical protein